MGGLKRKKWNAKANWQSGKHGRAEGDEGSAEQGHKRHKHDGEYPPPHVLESELFESYYRESGVIPEAEWDAFIKSLRTPLGTSFRITGHPNDPATCALRKYMEDVHISRMGDLEVSGEKVPPPYPIEWYPGRNAWRFDVSRSVLRGKGARKDGVESKAVSPETEAILSGFHTFLMAEVELGTISRQEEVSMVPPCLLDVQPGHRVLDMCASPGSKTQQLIEALTARGSEFDALPGESGLEGTSLVIANDADYKRCHLLVHQAKRLHSPALVVTHHDATLIPTRMASPQGLTAWGGAKQHMSFDRVLCDVPCSGDGTLRKSPDLWRRWGDGLALGVHRAQYGILARGLQLLVPGGRLVYSTCSMNPIEDEAVIAHALLKMRQEGHDVHLRCADDQLPQLKRIAGVKQWRVRYKNEWYSTIDAVPEELRQSRKVLPTMFPPTDAEVATLHLERCMRVLPHFQDTGGFFIAVLEKRMPTDATSSSGAEVKLSQTADASNPVHTSSASGPEEPIPSVPASTGDVNMSANTSHTAAAGASSSEGKEGGDAAGEPVVATIRSQAHAKAGSHVLSALHRAPSNNGAYDALYRLTPEWIAELVDFLGLKSTFDGQQVVSRSITGKQARLPVLQLLNADRTFKLKLVNTGTRILERSDLRGLAFPFRLTQEGAHCMLPHMSKQVLFADRADMAQLLKCHSVTISQLKSEALRSAARACQPGCCVIVFDDGTGSLAPGERPLLVVAAMRSKAQPGFIELNVKKAEAQSMLRRLGTVVAQPATAEVAAAGEEDV
ncbi:MAG: hypothetical protein SGPRY_007077 [Prymnesium sp.]